MVNLSGDTKWSRVVNLEYQRSKSKRPGLRKLVAQIPAELVKEIDVWGVPAGMKSRREAIETLLSRGLQSVRADQAKAG
jgi:hypothetical protein